MLFPIGDDNSDRTTIPYVTYALIALNVIVWLLFQHANGESPFTLGYSTIPFEIQHNTDLVGPDTIKAGGEVVRIMQYKGPWPIFLTLLTSMFMHASWMHIGGNMLYLWIFGDNVEDRLGHVRYLLFYLFCGAIAAIGQSITNPYSIVPMVGASGAIAGVMGAYFVLYPHSRVLTAVFIFFYLDLVEIPAIFFLGIWFFMQLFSGVGSIGADAASGGVAFWAHVGGFIAGAGLGALARLRGPSAPRRELPQDWQW